jgi:hypothetical protein
MVAERARKAGEAVCRAARRRPSAAIGTHRKQKGAHLTFTVSSGPA